jgi:hypothetical protein
LVAAAWRCDLFFVAVTRTFYLGNIVATPGALAALRETNVDPLSLLLRHVRNDWGELTAEDKRLNDEAIRHGGRILSAYILPDGVKLWVITEAQAVDDDPRSRMSTCLLLPSEY